MNILHCQTVVVVSNLICSLLKTSAFYNHTLYEIKVVCTIFERLVFDKFIQHGRVVFGASSQVSPRFLTVLPVFMSRVSGWSIGPRMEGRIIGTRPDGFQPVVKVRRRKTKSEVIVEMKART